MKTILLFLIFILFTGVSFGQINVSGEVYSDSTLTKSIPRAKLTLRTDSLSKSYRSDRNGKFNIVAPNSVKEFSLQIEKKGHIGLIVESINQDLECYVILGKALSVHDKGYTGSAKLIVRN